MEPITIYLILSFIINLILFLLCWKQKEQEKIQEQIIKEQEKQIELLKRISEIKNETK